MQIVTKNNEINFQIQNKIIIRYIGYIIGTDKEWFGPALPRPFKYQFIY